VPRVCWSACVVGCTLCSVCPAGVTGRAFEPGAGAGACGSLPLGATFTPLDGGVVCVGVLPLGAGCTGAGVTPPGCCAITPGLVPPAKNRSARAMIARLKLRRFITILSIADCGFKRPEAVFPIRNPKSAFHNHLSAL
jgi:hypothetical protein